MASTRLILAAGLLGLIAGSSLATHRRREAERRAQHGAAPEPLQTWEGEGGAVPLRSGRTAQQVTPTMGQGQSQGMSPGFQEAERFESVAGTDYEPQTGPRH